MKSNTLFFVLCFLLCQSSINLVAQPEKEVSLKQVMHAMPYTTFKEEAGDFKTYFRTTTGNFSTIQPERLIKKQLMSLRDKLPTGSLNQGEYFTAIRVYFGLEGSNTLHLIYKPVIAKLRAINPFGGDTVFYEAPFWDYPAADGDSVYILTGLNLVGKRAGDVRSWITNYRAHMLFRRGWWAGSTEASFTEGIDIKSCLLPFQEVDSLMGDVEVLWVTSRAHLPLEYGRRDLIHTIAIASDQLNPANSPSKSYVADLMGACPPKCQEQYVVHGGLSAFHEIFPSKSITDYSYILIAIAISVVVGVVATLGIQKLLRWRKKGKPGR